MTVFVFHYTKRENWESIRKKGLLPQAQFDFLGSRLRRDIAYGWLHPADDRMGCQGHPGYLCLRLEADEKLCLAAPMEMASAAYACFQARAEDRAEWLMRRYDEAAVPVREYDPGNFLFPEVLVRSAVGPEFIELAGDRDLRRRRLDGMRFYHERLLVRLNAFLPAPAASLSECLGCLQSLGCLERFSDYDDIAGPVATCRCAGLPLPFSIHESYLKSR
ncbi:MAG: hypothetical protein IT210_02620 [Armatimonadetes bacterium]|nr:hypothetical protein [Armatimonadota bacterium]